MNTEQKAKYQRKPGVRKATRFPGIIGDAEALGVNRATLYKALVGYWKLPGLVKRYKALKKQQGKALPEITEGGTYARN